MIRKTTFTARVWKEDDQYIAQCLDVDIASQGDSEEDALDMLKDALELYFAKPHPGALPTLRTFEMEIDAA